MRRVMACGIIGTYLLMLVFGLFSHALGYKSTDHVGMYFLVWDMYCGWCGYEVRHHIVAQGESGQYYELSPPPWGDFVAFGAAGRHDYDCSASFTGTLTIRRPMSFSHTSPAVTNSLRMVSRCRPVMRSVDRTEQPSMRSCRTFSTVASGIVVPLTRSAGVSLYVRLHGRQR